MVCNDTPGTPPQSFNGQTIQDEEDQFISEPAGVWGQGLRRIIELGKDSREDEGRNITQLYQMFESERALKPREQVSILIDEKTEPQRRPMTPRSASS